MSWNIVNFWWFLTRVRDIWTPNSAIDHPCVYLDGKTSLPTICGTLIGAKQVFGDVGWSSWVSRPINRVERPENGPGIEFTPCYRRRTYQLTPLHTKVYHYIPLHTTVYHCIPVYTINSHRVTDVDHSETAGAPQSVALRYRVVWELLENCFLCKENICRM